MTTLADNPRDLIAKINFVRTSRKLKNDGAIEEHLTIPTNREEEQTAVVEYLFRYLKQKFVGCKIRNNTHTFSVRLDGIVHRRAEKLRKDIWDNYEWRRWLEQNHRELSRTIGRNQQAFRGHQFQTREKEGRTYLYIPHRIDRIQNYMQDGLIHAINSIDTEYKRDEKLHGIYDEVINLIEAETQRREEERRRRLQAELDAYGKLAKEKLLKPIDSLTDNRNTVSGKLKRKMTTWCVENGYELLYAEEPTHENVAPIDTKVRVMNEEGSKEENWFVIPVFEGIEPPEGYVIQEGWGKVTKHTEEDERSRNGHAPVVVENYIYLQFNLDHWKDYLPENYWEYLEATRRFREEAEAECAEEACEEETTQEEQPMEPNQEAAEQVEEAAEQVEQEANPERRRALAEQLRAQLEQQEEQETPWGVPETPEPAPAEEGVAPTPPTSSGIYLNSMAIPLERYVIVHGREIKARRRTLEAVDEYLRSQDFSPRIAPFHVVRDYQDPDRIIEYIN